MHELRDVSAAGYQQLAQPLLGEGVGGEGEGAERGDPASRLIGALQGFKTDSARARRALQHRVFGATVFCAMVAVATWRLVPPHAEHFSIWMMAANTFLIPYTLCPMMVLDRAEFESGYLPHLLGLLYSFMAVYWLWFEEHFTGESASPSAQHTLTPQPLQVLHPSGRFSGTRPVLNRKGWRTSHSLFAPYCQSLRAFHASCFLHSRSSSCLSSGF
jgi:hypothetical protein